MRLATYNVHKCRGWDGRCRPDRIAEVIAETGAAIVAVQEADRRLGRRSGLLDTDGLARRAGLRVLPVSSIDGGHGWHGNALLAGPDVSLCGEVLRLGLPGIEPRGALVAVLEIAGWGRLRMVTAHLGLLPGCRDRQAGMLMAVLEAHHDGLPTVLMGDLNEWRRGGAAMRSLARRFHRCETVASFPSLHPILALDRIMATANLRVSGMRAHASALALAASDHLPLVADISLAD